VSQSITNPKFLDGKTHLSYLNGQLFIGVYAEERERPELLAESRERRKRVAKDSGKTEQQVQFQYSYHTKSFPIRSSISQTNNQEIRLTVPPLSGEPIGRATLPNACKNAENDGRYARKRVTRHGRAHGIDES
jgi:hypothetical protein